MKIRYHWEKLKINYPKGYLYRTQIKDVDYEYEVDVKVQDIVDYLIPYHLATKKNKTKEEIEEVELMKQHFEKALKFVIGNCSLSSELDSLENDEYFAEFMKERYEDRAFEEWKESNESY